MLPHFLAESRIKNSLMLKTLLAERRNAEQGFTPAYARATEKTCVTLPLRQHVVVRLTQGLMA